MLKGVWVGHQSWWAPRLTRVCCTLADVCPHRGAPMHMGWVESVGGRDCIVCPYHGWAFDTEGTLRHVPAVESERESPVGREFISAYPVEERVCPKP